MIGGWRGSSGQMAVKVDGQACVGMARLRVSPGKGLPGVSRFALFNVTLLSGARSARPDSTFEACRPVIEYPAGPRSR